MNRPRLALVEEGVWEITDGTDHPRAAGLFGGMHQGLVDAGAQRGGLWISGPAKTSDYAIGENHRITSGRS